MAFHIPFLSRLHLREYFALFLSFHLILLESFIAVITLALPSPIINLCYYITRGLFIKLSSTSSLRLRQKKNSTWSAVANASDFTELCEIWGYYCEEHIVQTGDGYLLGLHRLSSRAGEENVRVNAGPGKAGIKKKVMYLHHGLMMNSEVWVCLTERQRCLPFELVERGYDVWLGNNRGNKYSKKSVHTAPTSAAFWNFSMDQFAFHDIPDSIDYVLQTTHQPSLSYIGFSQGTAQAFATLSIHPTLNEKVNVFIALAPAMSPPGLNSGIVDSFVKASPDILYLAFGRKSILPSTTMWQSILYPPIFVRVIDTALRFLFGWSAVNILPDQKLAAYPHLFSYTSTKSVVHWFQIIRNGVFQMYDDEAPSPFSNRSKYYKVAKFPTRNIKTPIVLMYGGSDSLVDIKIMLKELPRHTIAKEIPHYEHLDFLWAQSVDQLVFPHVFEALDKHAGLENVPSDSLKDGYFPRLLPSPDDLPDNAESSSPTTPVALQAAKKFSQTTRRVLPMDNELTDNISPLARRTMTMSNALTDSIPPLTRRALTMDNALTDSISSPLSKPAQLPRTSRSPENYTAVMQRKRSPSEFSTNSSLHVMRNSAQPTESPTLSHTTAHTSNSKPEGWWSSDDLASRETSAPSTPSNSRTMDRQMSIDSTMSARSLNLSKFGNKGITLGAAKAVSGIVGSQGSQFHKKDEEAKRKKNVAKKSGDAED